VGSGYFFAGMAGSSDEYMAFTLFTVDKSANEILNGGALESKLRLISGKANNFVFGKNSRIDLIVFTRISPGKMYTLSNVVAFAAISQLLELGSSNLKRLAFEM
jgi:hypothetical protein